MNNKDFSGIRNNGNLPDPWDVNIPDDVRDLLGDYADSTNSMLDELEKAALLYEAGDKSNENIDTIKRVLHKIKGESSMVGIEEITECTHQAEFAFEELNENQRPDMLLKYRDWTGRAICYMTEHV